MIDKALVCQVNMFDMNQMLYETDTENGKLIPIGTTTIDELPHAVINYCIGSHTSKVHFYGNDTYLFNMIDYMKVVMKQAYNMNENEIIMEVN